MNTPTKILTQYHKEKYGGTNIHNARKPDPELCCVEVSGDTGINSFHFSQCSRKAIQGPESAYCKQHNPDFVKAKNDARQLKDNFAWWTRFGQAAATKHVADAAVAFCAGGIDMDVFAQTVTEYNTLCENMAEKFKGMSNE